MVIIVESIKEHNALVDKLVEQIQTQWLQEDERLRYKIGSYMKEVSENKSPVDTEESELMFLSHAVVLRWVKENILDNNGAIFRTIFPAIPCQNKDMAAFWVDRETIEILINKPVNIIAKLCSNLSLYSYSINALDMLFCLDETNISQTLVTVFDQVMVKKWQRKNSQNE